MRQLPKEAIIPLCKGFASSKAPPKKTSLVCECGGEIVYPERGVIHLDPPRKRTKCLECGKKGFEEIQEERIDK